MIILSGSFVAFIFSCQLVPPHRLLNKLPELIWVHIGSNIMLEDKAISGNQCPEHQKHCRQPEIVFIDSQPKSRPHRSEGG